MPLQLHHITCDILVAGGGAAGVPCALAAARSGAKVVLCQDRPVLGGNASSEVRMHIVGANGAGRHSRGAELATEVREGGVVEEIRLQNCVENPQRSASVFDLILYDKCRTEPNLTLLLNTTVTGATVENGRITVAQAERQSTEDQFAIEAKVFIDCTGDGRLGVEAGAAFMEGRESQNDFHESLAQPIADQQRLGSTVLLQAKKHDRPMPFTAPAWARRFTKEELRLRLYATPGEEEPTHEYGYWWAEWGGVLDTIKQNETIRDELLAVALGVWDHVKNGPPDSTELDPLGASHWALEWIGFLPGKRESRRFVGRRVLTEHDILQSAPFDDAIAYGGWSLDLHPPGGIDAPDEQPCVQHPVPYLYDIPLSACIARDVKNLMFAGRNLSATHVAFSSTRVMATCAVVGQGVGVAAAHASLREQGVDDLVFDPNDVATIQQKLLRDDAFLIGRANEDRSDLAKSALITASSEQPGAEARQVISGYTRSVHGEHGAPPDRQPSGLHRWMSQPCESFPAWIQLAWDQPTTLSEVQLIFDTGQHRHLTLSHHDGYTQRMKWGRPQPETVRDYSIEAWIENRWAPLVNVRENHQRMRRHAIEAIGTDRLRIVVRETNGLDHARILEVRAYA